MHINSGHKVTKNLGKLRNGCHQGCLTKHSKFRWSMIRDMCSFATCELCSLELPKFSKDQRALKFIKKKMRTHISVKRKLEKLSSTLATMRKPAARKD